MLGEVEWLETVRQPLQGVVYACSRYYHHRLVRTTLSGWFSRLTGPPVGHQLKQGYASREVTEEYYGFSYFYYALYYVL